MSSNQRFRLFPNNLNGQNLSIGVGGGPPTPGTVCLFMYQDTIQVSPSCLSVIVYYTEDRRWMETALSLSVEHGLLDLLQYLVDTVGVTLTGELYCLLLYSLDNLCGG